MSTPLYFPQVGWAGFAAAAPAAVATVYQQALSLRNAPFLCNPLAMQARGRLPGWPLRLSLCQRGEPRCGAQRGATGARAPTPQPRRARELSGAVSRPAGCFSAPAHRRLVSPLQAAAAPSGELAL